MKKVIALLTSLVILFLLYGYVASKASETNGAAATLFTDSTGRQIAVPSKITRIAVTGPLSQIVLYSLAPEILVGFSSDWSNEVRQYIPEKYLKLPVIGQLYGGKGDLNLEELLKADPDVVIDLGETKPSMKEDMDKLQNQTGIPFVHIDATTQTFGTAYRLLGKLLDLEERAETYASYCDKVYNQTVKIADAMGDKKTSVLYVLGDKGQNVIAKGSYHSEVIDLLCNNLAVMEEPSSKGTGNEVDLEQILKWNPEVIIFSPDSIYDTVADDITWQHLEAVKNGSYYKVPFGPYNWLGFPPSVQRYLGMLWLSELLYPEKTNYELKTEVIKYYNMFYHYTLTEEQYQNLMRDSLPLNRTL